MNKRELKDFQKLIKEMADAITENRNKVLTATIIPQILMFYVGGFVYMEKGGISIISGAFLGIACLLFIFIKNVIISHRISNKTLVLDTEIKLRQYFIIAESNLKYVGKKGTFMILFSIVLIIVATWYFITK